MAVQMAKWAGATVIATASARHHAFLRTLGADEIVDYTTTRFEEVVRNVDMVLDTIGGETVARSWHIVKKGGLLLSVFSPPSQEQAAAFGVRAFFFVVKPNREQLIHIGNLIDTGQLRPITERVFPLSEASQAFEQALQGHTRGKIILRVEDEERRG
jgi:NADPH:quinone reductase-like Zn-dependent oxidoreductase